MENITKYIQQQKNYNTLLSVVNLVCEISEGGKTKNKHTYAAQMFLTIAGELRAQGKISETLYFQCKSLTPFDLDHAINDTIALWNRVVPLYKRVRRSLRTLRRLCRK